MTVETQIPEMVPIDMLAARLGVSSWTIRTWLRQRKVPFFKVGRRVLIKLSDMEELLAASYVEATRPMVTPGTRPSRQKPVRSA
jgi:excisionase family DNA binding protein